MKEKKWPIFVHTHNRKNLKLGDNVVFYKAGLEGQKFLGTARLNSEIEKTSRIDYFVKLSNIEVWENSVKVVDLIDELNFIKDKQVWGRFFQGGVKKISEKDFSLITHK